MLGQVKAMNVPRFLGEGDRYKIEEQIGRGGMGAVYRAYDKNTDRQVAVKIILDVSSADAMTLFDKEWRILSELQHVNVVGITDRGEFRDGPVTRPYFVMPFLRGKTLQQRIADTATPLRAEEVVEIISAAAAGLHAAHLRGVIHRDVKPSNIFALDSGSVVVIDFGVVHFSEKGDITTIKGTTQYIAPELIDPEKKDLPSPRSDLFSLGVVCYEALTRIQPFSHDSTKDTVRALLKMIPAPAYELNRDVSLGISQVAQKAMAKNKNYRYASVIEFAGRLQRALRNEPLPEFDKSSIETRLKVVRDAFAKGQVTAAQELLRGIEEEGFVDPAISNQRQKIDRALEQKWISEHLQSVRLHREVGNFNAALDKLDAVLKTVPENAEAIRERELINAERLKRALSEADGYMRSHDFGNARKSIEEARQIEPKDSSTTELLLELTRLEEADRRLSEQKETLFVEAQAAMRGGHTPTALHKLERLLDLIRTQGAGFVSDRDEIYKHYQDEIFTEHTRVRRAFDEAKQHLEKGNLSQVLGVCDEMLAMNPGHPLFVGMKLQAENRDRQLRFERVQGVCSTLAEIPDLERQVDVLQDALNRHPGEPQLTEMLRNVKGRRDLVSALVANARKAENSGQYNSALDTWETLREFHPSYPGLDGEISRVNRRRNDQVRADKKSLLIEEAERLIRLADYDGASELCSAALGDFPANRELLALLADTTERATRANEAREMLAKSRELARSGQGEAVLTLLRQAHALDQNNQEIKQFLGVALLDRAQTVLETDGTAADDLVAQARELIPNDPAVKSIGTLLDDRKQREGVEKCLTEARRMALDGDTRGALEQIDAGLKVYPNDRRLAAERTKLIKATGMEPMPTPVSKAGPVREQPPIGDGNIRTGKTQPESGDSMFQVRTMPEDPGSRDETRHFPLEEKKGVLAVWRARFGCLVTRARAIPPLRVGSFSIEPYILAAAAVFVIFAIAASWLATGNQGSGAAVGAAPKLVKLDVTTSPEAAEVLVDGQKRGVAPISTTLPAGDHVIQVSLPGYEVTVQQVKAGTLAVMLPMKLRPIPMAIHLSGGDESATVALDEHPPVKAESGSAALETTALGSHSLKIASDKGESTVQLYFQPGEPPKTTGVMLHPGASLLVVSSFGGKVRMRVQGLAAIDMNVDKQDYKLTADNTEIQLPPGPHEIAAGGSVFPVEIGLRHELNLAFMAAAPARRAVKSAASWRAEIDWLMEKRKYKTAYSRVRLWLQSEPTNGDALKFRSQLEARRDLDPESWK